MKPTEEQIKEFWEWCGFLVGANGAFTMGWYRYPDETIHENLPSIDLNNLFKYMPKDKIDTIQFSWGTDGCHCWIYMKKIVGKPFHGNGSTEEDALFWALDKVRQGGFR